MTNREIPLRQAYRQLGKLVKAAAYGGESAIITERGRPAAMLTPVPEHILVSGIWVDVADSDGWRDRAVTAWIEAAADEGWGFTVGSEYVDGDVVAAVQRDNWDNPNDVTEGGARYELVAEWPEQPDPQDRGKGHVNVLISARPA